jgi:hypothetical protein
MHRRSLNKDLPITVTEEYSEGSQLTPRTRKTASLFVADWIDNAPFDGPLQEQEIEKPKYFARTKNVPRSGPFSAMYFGNDVLLCARNRTSGESQEMGKNRSSLRPPSASIDTSERIQGVCGETESSSPARSRVMRHPSPKLSSISLADDSRPVGAQRARREKVSQKPSKTPSNRQTSVRTTNAESSEEAVSDQDLFRRERECFLKERSVFLREREQFLTDKARFHSEKEKLLQDIQLEREGIARDKEELAHQRGGATRAAAKDTKAVEVSQPFDNLNQIYN